MLLQYTTKILRFLIHTSYFRISGRCVRDRSIVEAGNTVHFEFLCFKFVPINFQKRPCLEDSSWHTENTSNLETENRLLSCTQPTILENRVHDYNQPLSDRNAAEHNGHLDINCNIVYRANNCQEMDISYDSAMTRSQAGVHRQSLLVSEYFFGCI